MSTRVRKSHDGVGKFSVKIIEVDPERRRPRSCMYFANPFAAKKVHDNYKSETPYMIVNEEGTEMVPLDASRHFYSWSYAETIRKAYRKIYDEVVAERSLPEFQEVLEEARTDPNFKIVTHYDDETPIPFG